MAKYFPFFVFFITLNSYCQTGFPSGESFSLTESEFHLDTVKLRGFFIERISKINFDRRRCLVKTDFPPEWIFAACDTSQIITPNRVKASFEGNLNTFFLSCDNESFGDFNFHFFNNKLSRLNVCNFPLYNAKVKPNYFFLKGDKKYLYQIFFMEALWLRAPASKSQVELLLGETLRLADEKLSVFMFIDALSISDNFPKSEAVKKVSCK